MSLSCAAPLRIPMKADSTAFTTCSGPALRRSRSPGFRSAGAATIIPVSPRAGPAFHLEKCVRQRHRVHVLRHPGIDDEHDWHALHLARRQRLLRKAEALELPEMARSDLRPVARHRLAGDLPVRIVANLERDLHERAGMDLDALFHRREGPG